MKRVLSAVAAARILQIALVLLTTFHVLVLVEFIPSDIVWGGEIADSSELLIKEMIALTVTLLFLIVVTLRLRDVRMHANGKGLRIGVWIIGAYFLVNTVGNLASGVAAENLIFAPLTVILALLAFRLGLID